MFEDQLMTPGITEQEGHPDVDDQGASEVGGTGHSGGRQLLDGSQELGLIFILCRLFRI